MSNDVLDRALTVEVDIARLRQAVADTSAVYQRDVKHAKDAETRLELAYAAYAELMTAMKDIETAAGKSKDSLELALAAKRALADYENNERTNSGKVRHTPHPIPRLVLSTKN